MDDIIDEATALAMVAEGQDARDILLERLPRVEARFRKVDASIIQLLAEVREVFPDAQYYTASGGFNLMLGNSHDKQERGQQQLVALSGRAQIGDGDF